MPIYEYECSKCGHQMEVWQKLSDPPVKKCDQCHGKVRKLISHSAFHLKGTGWYVTDYADKSGGAPKKEKEPVKEKSSGDTKKTESASKKKKDT